MPRIYTFKIEADQSEMKDVDTFMNGAQQLLEKNWRTHLEKTEEE